MISFEMHITIEPRHRLEILQLARSLLARSRPSQCSFRAMFEDIEAPGHLLWIEHWIDAADLEAHRQSDAHRALVGGARVLGSIESTLVSHCTEEPPPSTSHANRAMNADNRNEGSVRQ